MYSQYSGSSRTRLIVAGNFDEVANDPMSVLYPFDGEAFHIATAFDNTCMCYTLEGAQRE